MTGAAGELHIFGWKRLSLGLAALVYGVLNLVAAVSSSIVPSFFGFFLIAGLLPLLARIHPVLVTVPSDLLSLPFLVGGAALIAGAPWGQRMVGIGACTVLAVFAAGLLLSSISGLYFLAPFLGPYARMLFRIPLVAQMERYTRLLGYLGFAALPAVIPPIGMWLAALGKPSWLSNRLSRINVWAWAVLFVLSILSGSVLFFTMWVTAPLTQSPNHSFYTYALYGQAAIYFFTLVTSRRWFVIAAMLLLAPSVAGSVIEAALYGVCFFFHQCL